MRIVAGEFRGRQLKSPTWEGLRPTSDRLRETISAASLRACASSLADSA